MTTQMGLSKSDYVSPYKSTMTQMEMLAAQDGLPAYTPDYSMVARPRVSTATTQALRAPTQFTLDPNYQNMLNSTAGAQGNQTLADDMFFDQQTAGFKSGSDLGEGGLPSWMNKDNYKLGLETAQFLTGLAGAMETRRQNKHIRSINRENLAMAKDDYAATKAYRDFYNPRSAT
jgi:hypothetical protein